MCAIPINEVPALRVGRDVMTPTEHGCQHGIFVAPQSRQSCGEVSPSNVKRDNLRKLERNSCMFSQARGMRARAAPFAVFLDLINASPFTRSPKAKARSL